MIKRYRMNHHHKTTGCETDAIRRPVEVVELSFQMAIQIIVGIFLSRLHSVLPFLTIVSKQIPISAVFFSVIQAKTLVDILFFYKCCPICFVTMAQRHHRAHAQRINPFSTLGLELNMLGTLLGVSVGRSVVTFRESFLRTVTSSAALLSRFLLPAFFRSVTNRTPCTFTASLVRTTSILLIHFAGCIIFAPYIVRDLAKLVEEAQMGRHCLLHTALKCVGRRITRLCRCTARQGACQEALCWDDPKDVEVPIDLICPITSALFVSPVVLHGAVFEEFAVRRWVEKTSRHPTLQDVQCTTSDLEHASDVANLCSRFGAAHGLQLRPDHERQ